MAHRIAGAKELLGQGLIDDNQTGLASRIARRENASSPDWDAHRREVSRRHPSPFRLWLIARRDGWLSLHLDAARVFATVQRQVGNRSGGAQNREGFQACCQFLEESSRPTV